MADTDQMAKDLKKCIDERLRPLPIPDYVAVLETLSSDVETMLDAARCDLREHEKHQRAK